MGYGISDFTKDLANVDKTASTALVGGRDNISNLLAKASKELLDPLQVVEDGLNRLNDADLIKDTRNIALAITLGPAVITLTGGAALLGLASIVLDGKNPLDAVGETMHIISGEYNREQQALIAKQERLENLSDITEAELDALDDGFLGEIFQLANANDSRRLENNLEQAIKEYEEAISNVEGKISTIASMDKGIIANISVAMLKIYGGLTNATRNILEGKDIVENLITIVGTTASLAGLGIMAFAGVFLLVMGIPLGALFLSGAIAGLLVLVYQLDAMYAGGVILGTTFVLLDTVVNDLLKLNTLSDEFNNLKKDGEHYEEWKANFQTALTIYATIASLAYAYGSKGNATALLPKSPYSGTLSTLYQTAMSAKTINDIVESNEALDTLKKELESERIKATNKAIRLNKQKVQKSYKQQANIQTEEDIAIERYLLARDNDATFVIDPEMLIRGNPDVARNNTRSAFVYGFEDVLYDAKAGDIEYIDSVIYQL